MLKSASTNDELRKTPSFMLPLILNRLMSALDEEKAGPFRLTNRDFGAHNILWTTTSTSSASSTLTAS